LGRPQVSFAKRQREQAKRERQEAKAARRAARKNAAPEGDESLDPTLADDGSEVETEPEEAIPG
jgi:sRNA-binding protein